MARNKDQKLSLSDLTAGLQANKLAMSPAIAAQIESAMQAPAAPTESVPLVSAPKSDNISKLNSSIVKLIAAIEKNTKVLDAKSRITKGNSPSSANDLTENQIENQKVTDHQTELLEKIEKNTRGGTGGGTEEKEDKKPKFGIGGWLTAIAIALGAAAGIFIGKLKAFMLVMKGFGKMVIGLGTFLKNLIPEAIRADILKKFKAIKTFFIDLGTKIMINFEYALNIFKDFFKNRFAGFIKRIQTVFKTVAEFAANVANTLRGWGSKIVKTFKMLKTAIANFFRPIGEAWDIIKTYSTTVGKSTGKVTSFFKGIGEFFGKIGGKLGAFSKVFGAVTKIFSKLAYPITIIMGVFDGVMGAIEGFKKDGLVGGIFGFIKGAWNSIVSSFLDLIKDMVSWVLEKFGFKDAAKWLDSWSFEDLFNSFWDTIAKPFKWIQDFFTNLEIPKFDVSVFGKKFEFGPWKLGSGDASTTAKTSADSKTQPDTKAKKQDSGAKAAESTKVKGDSVKPADSANKVYKQSADNKEADKQTVKPSTNTVISAPTQVNTQTQNAFVKTPVRNTDSTFNRYLSYNF